MNNYTGQKMVQAKYLESLGSTEPYFNSKFINYHIAQRAKEQISRIDEIFNSCGVESVLGEYVSRLNEKHFVFLIRSVIIRNIIEDLVFLAQNNFDTNQEIIQALHHEFNTVLSRLVNLVDSNIEPFPGSVSDIGFDTAEVITEPYPYNICAWRGVSSIDEKRNWSEAKRLENLFDKINNHVGDVVKSRTHILKPIDDVKVDQLKNALAFIQSFSTEMIQDIVYNIRHFCLIGLNTVPEGFNSIPAKASLSMTFFYLPMCSFFSDEAFEEFPLLIESIYHESLHNKYTNLLCILPIIDQAEIKDSNEKFHCPWVRESPDGNHLWAFDRVFAAFQVYVHLHVFYASILEESKFNIIPQAWAEERKMIAIDKGTKLEKCLSNQMINMLTDTGKEFLHQMKGIFYSSVNANSLLSKK